MKRIESSPTQVVEMNTLRKTRTPKLALLSALLVIPFAANALNATQSDGTLSIKGTKKNDWITVSSDGGGVMEVRGGKNADELLGIYTDVTNLKIKAKGGNNRITLTGISVTGAVMVNAGSGNDVVSFGGQFSAEGDLEVDLNGGNNKVLTDAGASVHVQGSAMFDGNKGDDKIVLSSLSIGGFLMIDMAGGADTIRLGQKNTYSVSVGEGVMIMGGRGDNTISIDGADVVSTMQLATGGGLDKITLRKNRAGEFVDIHSGGSSDQIVSRNNTVSGEYSIHCGSGDDELTSKNDSAVEILEQRCADNGPSPN